MGSSRLNSVEHKAGSLATSFLVAAGIDPEKTVGRFRIVGGIPSFPGIPDHVRLGYTRRRKVRKSIPLNVFFQAEEGTVGRKCVLTLAAGANLQRVLRALEEHQNGRGTQALCSSMLEVVEEPNDAGVLQPVAIYITARLGPSDTEPVMVSCRCPVSGRINPERICAIRGEPCALARIPGIEEALDVS